jgi:DNA polymerase-3 subunit epsilon
VYAIVDIETTGGHADANGITEIAIYVHDGEKVIDEFVSLINPECYIPAFISGYTGITNEMVENAPIFEDVAEQIHDMLKDHIFVAHNVNFDYSFIKSQLQHCGYDLNTSKLCTVRLSRNVFPGYKSYSLGNICGSLDIPISDRHRAAGDAKATVILFEKILQNDSDSSVIKSFLKRGSKEHNLPPNLPKEQFEKLPHQTGVYFFHDETGKVVYVGKAKNIKKRVGSHFSGNSTSRQRQDFMRSIHGITFTECATELMAFILESVEIKKHWPAFNRALKKLEFNFGIYDYQDRNDYIRLGIERVRKNIVPLYTFRTQLEAIGALQQLVEEFELCPKLCHLNTSKEPCGDASECHGACHMIEDPETYNARVDQAIAQLTTHESYAIIDKGLYSDERSCILIENGKFVGMGYMPIDAGTQDLESIRTYIKPHKESFYIREMLQSETLTATAKRISFEYTSA